MATAHIKLSALSHNLERIRFFISQETQILVAVKANAYGHGAVHTARFLETQGVTWFGVATATEALELRLGGISANILIFTPVYEGLTELIEQDIALCVADDYSFECIRSVKTSKPARLHLKVDTGMGRLGLGWQESIELATRIDASAQRLEGVWTHFAASDDADKHFTECQIEAFELFLAALSKNQVYPKLRHTSNSAAVFGYPQAHYDIVRPGIAVYGYHSSPFTASLEPNLKPALSLSAPITFIKDVKKGTSISYSNLWQAPKDTRIASVRIGYADGYPRLLTGKARVLVQNQLRQVAGRVCMDQLMVDVGDLDVSIGEHVTLYDAEQLNAETLAARIGTISYELLTSLSPRVKRVYEK